jgi:hypothetical protein
MATPTVKTTYALDLQTIRSLERLARRWNVSRSEALRRAIRASAEVVSGAPLESVDALDRLQRALRLEPQAAERWSAAVRAQRRASSLRGEQRPR